MDTKPAVIPRKEHTISRKDLDKYALKVLYRLNEAGFQAYLVGGCVRDLLLDKHPKDFDVATDATPEEVKELFKNCRIIGRRFRLAHIYFGRHIIEVATFRANTADDEHIEKRNGMLVRDNYFGNIEEDAWRRDFTINALYYNIANFSIVDYTGGLNDIDRREVHMIGDAETRYREDPVRILRAIRFAAKLNFNIAQSTAEPIKDCAETLEYVAPSRILDEMIKLFHCGESRRVYELIKQYGLFQVLLPATYSEWEREPKYMDALLTRLFTDTDQRIREDKTVSPIYLFAVMLWPAVITLNNEIAGDKPPNAHSLIEASYQILADQNAISSLPKRFQNSIHQIWRLQFRLEKRSPRNIQRILHSSRFRAALDLLRLRSHIDKQLKQIVEWWEIQEEQKNNNDDPSSVNDFSRVD